MNSRQRRKQAAQEHNARPALLQELKAAQSAILAKHGVWVRTLIDDSNDSVRREIAKLREIFDAPAPPPRPVAVGGGGGGLRAHQKLAVIAALAGIGALR